MKSFRRRHEYIQIDEASRNLASVRMTCKSHPKQADVLLTSSVNLFAGYLGCYFCWLTIEYVKWTSRRSRSKCNAAQLISFSLRRRVC